MSKAAIIHCCGMFAPSFGLTRSWCGKLLPRTAAHFSILGERAPRGYRRCKVCEGLLKKRNRRFGVSRQEVNRRISEGLRLAWKRRKLAATSPAAAGEG